MYLPCCRPNARMTKRLSILYIVSFLLQMTPSVIQLLYIIPQYIGDVDSFEDELKFPAAEIGARPRGNLTVHLTAHTMFGIL